MTGIPLCSTGISGGGTFGTNFFNFSGNGGIFSILTTVAYLSLNLTGGGQTFGVARSSAGMVGGGMLGIRDFRLSGNGGGLRVIDPSLKTVAVLVSLLSSWFLTMENLMSNPLMSWSS